MLYFSAEDSSRVRKLWVLSDGYSIIGRIVNADRNSEHVEGVVVKASNNTEIITDPIGYYTFTNIVSGTYILTPTLEGFAFSPPTRTVTVPPSAISQDFTAIPASTISGRIIDSTNTPASNVVVVSSVGVSTTTDSNGVYTLPNVVNGTYTLTPTLEGFNFTPANRTVVTVPPNATNQDFTQCGSLALAQKFSPMMFFNDDEHYRPIAVDVPLQHGDLVHYQFTSRVVDKPAPLTSADLLHPDVNTNDHWIDFEGDEDDGMLTAYQRFGGPSLPLLTYARIYCPPAPDPKYSMVIQYWFFYYDNPWYLNRHEGDWEMVQVMLDQDFNPVSAGYSQHLDGQSRPWQNMLKSDNHPYVYVAQDGHGSYFRDSWWSYTGLDDTTTNMSEGIQIPVQMVPIRTDKNSWLYFAGHWGRSHDFINDGPQGPQWRTTDNDISLWNTPIAWFESLSLYENSVAAKSGKINVLVDDALDIVIDKITDLNQVRASNANTLQSEDIEYFANPDTQRRVLIVHNPDFNALYRVNIHTQQPDRLPVEPIQFKLHFPDIQNSTVVSAEYQLPGDWNSMSQAVVTVNQTVNLALQIDLDGNGTTDQTLAPQKVDSSPFDFTPLLPSAPVLLLSSNRNGAVPGVTYRDEDILSYNQTVNTWTMVFDGSDVGAGNVDVDAFAFLPNGHLLLSFDSDFNLRSFGSVDDADILEFTPTSLGNVTSGSFSRYFDGSDVGLDTSGEDIDGIDFTPDSKLLLSVTGKFKAGNVTANDEDILQFNTMQLGETTAGTWQLHFKGANVGLTTESEDVLDTWTDSNGDIYLNTAGNFAVTGGLQGDGNDIFVCKPVGLGNSTSCNFTLYWDGAAHGMGTNLIDGFHIGDIFNPAITTLLDTSQGNELDDTVEFPGDDVDDVNELDGAEEPENLNAPVQIFLPLINR